VLTTASCQRASSQLAETMRSCGRTLDLADESEGQLLYGPREVVAHNAPHARRLASSG
jgi:hypothetical protein